MKNQKLLAYSLPARPTGGRLTAYSFLAVSCLLLAVSSAEAQKPGKVSVGYVKVGTQEVGSLSWRPDFKLGAWGVGLDVNIPLGDKRPSGYENVVLRFVEYDDGKRGLRYGAIEGLTWGHGLLLKNYTTRISGPVLLNNEQMGVKGYLNLDTYVVKGLWTRTNLYGVRAEEKAHPLLTLGQHFITDADGAGGQPSVSAVGADATVPLPYNFEFYADAAQILNHGLGVEAGFSWAYDLLVAQASLQGGYRSFSKGFIPSYFSADYEINPPNITSVEASTTDKNGTLVELKVDALGLAKVDAVYESYGGSNPSLTANLWAKVREEVAVGAYYKQPTFTDFRSLSFEQGAVLDGYVAYKINPMSEVITHYKKAYNPSTAKVEETQYYEVQFSF